MEFPSTHGALVEDRSGLAVRGVTTLAGVIDPGYRGEIKVVMTNLGSAAVEISRRGPDCAVADRAADRSAVRRGGKSWARLLAEWAGSGRRASES